MSEEKTFQNEIYAFSEGKCITLSAFEQSETNVKCEITLGIQFQDLVRMVQSLTTTVNSNAKYLKSLQQRNDFLEEELVKNNRDQNIAFSEHYQKFNYQKESKKDLAISNEMKQNTEFIKEVNQDVKNLKIQIKGINDKVRLATEQVEELKNHILSAPKNTSDEKLENLQLSFISQIEKIKQQLSDFALQREVEKQMNNIQDEVQQIQDSQFKNEIKVSEEFKKIYELIEESSKQKNQQINHLRQQSFTMEEMDKVYAMLSDHEVKLQEFSKLKEKQNSIIRKLKKLMKQELSIQNEARINEIQKKVFDDDNSLKIQIDENLISINLLFEKLKTKLERDQFFEFVAENFLKSEDFDMFKKQQEDVIKGMQAQQAGVDQSIKKFQVSISDKIDDIYHSIQPLDDKIEKNKQSLLKLMQIEPNNERMFNSLDQKIDKLQLFFIEQYQAKLNGLATAKGLQCLSCGEKEINYPPQNQFMKGTDDEMYWFMDKNFLKMNQYEKENTQQMNEKKPSLKDNRISSAKTGITRQQSAKTYLIKKGQAQDINAIINKNFTMGSEIFNKSHVVSEHFFKAHEPVGQLIEKKIYKKNYQRPFSSIHRKQLHYQGQFKCK